MSVPMFIMESREGLEATKRNEALPVVMRLWAYLKLAVRYPMSAADAQATMTEVIVSKAAKAICASDRQTREALAALEDSKHIVLMRTEGIQRKRIYRLPTVGAGNGGLERMGIDGTAGIRTQPTENEISSHIAAAVEVSTSIRREHANQSKREAIAA